MSGVHIVGLGAVSPLGLGVDAFWQGLFEEPAPPVEAAVRGLPADGKSMQHGHACVWAAPDTDAPTGRDRFSAIAFAAAQQALADARRRGCRLDEARVGLALGTAAGDAESAEVERQKGRVADFDRCGAYRAIEPMAQTLSDWLDLTMSGPTYSLSNACSAGLYAMAHAVEQIEDGHADAMLVLGVELLSRVTQAGFQRMTVLDPERCRPFDARRHGTVLGEGAAAVLLAAPHLLPGGADAAYCRVAATGLSCDAFHPTAPQPDGRDMRLAVERALSALRGPGAAIDIVVPHGTGTALNDRIEGDMLTAMAGRRVQEMCILPIKSHIGHCAGASGTFSAIAAAMALQAREVPPTLHIREPDPAIALRFSRRPTVLPHGLPLRALINAYGFGGNTISMVLDRGCHV